MYLVTVTFSYLLAASSVAALGSPHDLAGRLAKVHSDLARDMRISLKRAALPALADKWFNKKRAAAPTKQWCRVRPTSGLNASADSPTSPARHPPTTTGATTRATSADASSTSASRPTGTNLPTANSPWKLKVTNVSAFHADSGSRAESKPNLTFADLLGRQYLLRRLGLLVHLRSHPRHRRLPGPEWCLEQQAH